MDIEPITITAAARLLGLTFREVVLLLARAPQGVCVQVRGCTRVHAEKLQRWANTGFSHDATGAEG